MLPKAEGRWDSFCRGLRKICQVTDLHPETKEHFRSYPALVNERKINLMRGCNLIHPMSVASLIWNSIMVVVNLSHMFVSTLRIAYVIDPVHFSRHHYVDEALIVLDMMCWLDVIVKFNTGFKDKYTSNIVMERKRVAGRYLRRWLLPDLISSMPIAYIILSLPVKRTRCLLIAHFLPLLRTPRVYTALMDIQIFMKLFTSSYIWHGAVQLTVLFMMTTHWCGCLVYLPTILFYYCTGFTLFLASEPEELIVHAFIILFSTVFMVYILVFLLKVYMTLFSSTIRYNELMNQVKEYMRHKQFPVPLQKRVKTFYSQLYQKRYYKEESVLECLSEELRNEITLHTCRVLVDKVTLFKDVPASAVGSVLGCLKPEVYLPNDPVLRAGDDGNCMYFIDYGTVAIYSLKGVEVCHLEDGAHFGEVALLMRDSKRLVTVVAVEITQLYRLDDIDFRQYVLTNQILFERIQTLASQRMHEAVLVDRQFQRDREKFNEKPIEFSETSI
ncbi:potassium/sodium hyperpolarization-activated cyclic nucleotide-gated channel 3-like [Bombyx mandarina]|uniref:Potassium/sodium hyperpolarization-activated cyclic nucleotide-gated channel 3-like n=1 Tax=Bombyx mandarina TaxID=7092 RepID=A0A6J2JA68_BOMMA|nr:potassium/sodium hyperpolarization-activated cyclic nucleotide-gated channel 3-like [Bombyx mandarina]